MQNIEINFGVRPEGQMSMIFGLVEYEDGTMDEVNPSQIRFVDNKIKDYAFDDVKEDHVTKIQI